MNRRQAGKAAKRTHILATARALWAEPGTFERVSMRDIAAAAGFTIGAIYPHWPTKMDLWREAMGHEPPIDGPDVRAFLREAAGQANAERQSFGGTGAGDLPACPLIAYATGIVEGMVGLELEHATNWEDLEKSAGDVICTVMTAEHAIEIGRALIERGEMLRRGNAPPT